MLALVEPRPGVNVRQVATIPDFAGAPLYRIVQVDAQRLKPGGSSALGLDDDRDLGGHARSNTLIATL